MKSKNWLIGLGIAGLLLLSCAEKEKDKVSENTIATNVEVIEVEPSVFERYVETIGIIVPYQNVAVIAEEGGTLTKIFVDKGRNVRKDEPLAVLTNHILRAQLEQAKARYASDSLTYAHQKQLVSVNGIADVTLKQAKYRMQLSLALIA